jgi:hypothetical protein
MKKKKIIILTVLFLFLLIPIPVTYKDGGTKKYTALLYSVYDVHRLKKVENQNENEIVQFEYVEGTIIKILGIEVYNNTNPRISI